MKWILVYLYFTGTELQSTHIETFENMVDCFNSRESMSIDLGSVDGYYPVNHQAICVRIEQ